MLPKGELPRLAERHRQVAYRFWWRSFCSLLGGSSEEIAGIHNPAQHDIGCVFIHLLDVSDQAILLRRGLSRLGRQKRLSHQVWRRQLSCLILGRSSVALIGICEAMQ
jgi:hypothetical protein